MRVPTEPGCTPWLALEILSSPALTSVWGGSGAAQAKSEMCSVGLTPCTAGSLILLSDKQASTGCAGYQWFSWSLVLWVSPVGSCADVCPKGSICSMPSLYSQPLRRYMGSRETPGEFPVPTRTKRAAPGKGSWCKISPGRTLHSALGLCPCVTSFSTEWSLRKREISALYFSCSECQAKQEQSFSLGSGWSGIRFYINPTELQKKNTNSQKLC